VSAPRPVLLFGLQAPVRPVRVPVHCRKAPVAVSCRGVVVAAVTLVGAVSVSACGEAQRTKTVTVAAPAHEAATISDASPKRHADSGEREQLPVGQRRS